MKMNKETTIAFAGSNTAEILSSTNDTNLRNVISTEVYLLVAALYQQGFRTFLSGMSEGFEAIAAEAVLQFKYEKEDVQLITVQPDTDMKPEDYLLANSSQIICYDNGGNDAFYHRAEKEGVAITNLFACLSDYFANNSPAKQALQPFDNIDGFRYCKEGILLCYLYGEKPVIAPFENIEHVEQQDGKLYVTLINELEVDAYILTE